MQTEKEDSMGTKVKMWEYEEAQLTKEEYAEYAQMGMIFDMPAFLELQEQVNNQQLVMADILINSEYTVCLQEINNL